MSVMQNLVLFKFAPSRFALNMVTNSRFALLRFAPEGSTPIKVALDKFAP